MTQNLGRWQSLQPAALELIQLTESETVSAYLPTWRNPKKGAEIVGLDLAAWHLISGQPVVAQGTYEIPKPILIVTDI